MLRRDKHVASETQTDAIKQSMNGMPSATLYEWLGSLKGSYTVSYKNTNYNICIFKMIKFAQRSCTI